MKNIVLLMLTSVCIFASDAFISSQQLKEKLNNKNIVILDVTEAKTYAKGHIPNAILTNAGEFRKALKKHKLMKSPKEIESIARSFGINNDSEVVIYGHGKKKRAFKS